jgi:hypothetical protein
VDYAPRGFARIGSATFDERRQPQKLKRDFGEAEVEVPRNRNGTSAPKTD